MDDKMKAIWEQVKTERDELRVRIHLGKAELKDEWEIAEKKWHHAQHKLGEAVDGAEAVAEEAKQALVVVGEEMSAAYSRIRARLDD